jgi:hypothetical protein
MTMLCSAGHTLTYDWTIGEQLSPEQAVRDLNGVIESDFLAVLAERNLAYKGAYVELGAALASGKPVYIIGQGMDECLFLKHPLVSYVAGVEEIIERLRG